MHRYVWFAFVVISALGLTSGADARKVSGRVALRDAPTETYTDGTRKWTPAVSAETRYILTNQGSDLWTLDARPSDVQNAVVWSPRGDYFFFTMSSGDLQCDCRLFVLSVYSAKEVVQALSRYDSNVPIPLRTVTMRHRQSPAITFASWVDDGAAIEFHGIDDPQGESLRTPGWEGRDPSSVYRLNIASGVLSKIVDVPLSSQLAGYSRQSDAAIYTYQTSRDAPDDRYPIYSPSDRQIAELVTVGRLSPIFGGETYVAFRDHSPWQLKSGFDLANNLPWIAPDGRHAVMVRHPIGEPMLWSHYRGLRNLGRSSRPGEFSQFFWIDLERKSERPLLDAPTGSATEIDSRAKDRPQAFWSEDGKHVVLTYAALPLTPAAADQARIEMAYILDFDVEAGRWRILEPYRHSSGAEISDVSWRKPGKEILVQHTLNGKQTSGIIYEYQNNSWRSREADASLKRVSDSNFPIKPSRPNYGLSVTLQQDANHPPKVVASLNGHERDLTTPDPALRNVSLARSVDFSWKDHDGITRTAGLILPREMPSDGNRIPLVIQVGAYQPWLFRPDGPTSTALAAQAMAAQGMAVLNLSTPVPQVVEGLKGGSKFEMETFIDWVDLAVAKLSKDYPIDPNRVGLVGFSRGGYLVRYLITHPKVVRPAAAVIADSFTGSYSFVLSTIATGDEAASAYSYYPIYGGPFFKSKTAWLESEVSFNADQVKTPVLFADAGESLELTYDTIGAFKANRKPFDYLLLPHGTHQLTAPRQREASLTATTDWMAFWLLNMEIDRSSKVDRFVRWRALRDLTKEPQVN